MEFIWDPKKADLNIKKHKVSFEEAATVFFDSMAITFDDPDHSIDEQRFLTFGMSNLTERRLIIVSHTDSPGLIRIISAREMTTSERKVYEND